MYLLTTPDGLKTSDPRQMQKIAVDFYSDLKKRKVIPDTFQLLQQLPSIS